MSKENDEACGVFEPVQRGDMETIKTRALADPDFPAFFHWCIQVDPDATMTVKELMAKFHHDFVAEVGN